MTDTYVEESIAKLKADIAEGIGHRDTCTFPPAQYLIGLIVMYQEKELGILEQQLEILAA